jgi:hypothetical protein
MGGRLYVCELSEVSGCGVAKPANRTEQKNNRNETFSKTENSQHVTRTRYSQERENPYSIIRSLFFEKD